MCAHTANTHLCSNNMQKWILHPMTPLRHVCLSNSKLQAIWMLLGYFSTVPDKGMNTYAMESFKFFIFNKFAKM